MAHRPQKKDWVLTEVGFNKLLEAMNPDRQLAAEQYEHLRRSLIRYFDWRGSFSAERDADDTIDRVARKLCEEKVDDVYTYALGVARNVARESLRAQRKECDPVEAFAPLTRDPAEIMNSERRLECFESCLAELPLMKRELILGYYCGERRTKIANRRRMAEQAGVSLNHLRVQAHRIRESLESCVNLCLAARADDDLAEM